MRERVSLSSCFLERVCLSELIQQIVCRNQIRIPITFDYVLESPSGFFRLSLVLDRRERLAGYFFRALLRGLNDLVLAPASCLQHTCRAGIDLMGSLLRFIDQSVALCSCRGSF